MVPGIYMNRINKKRMSFRYWCYCGAKRVKDLKIKDKAKDENTST